MVRDEIAMLSHFVWVAPTRIVDEDIQSTKFFHGGLD